MIIKKYILSANSAITWKYCLNFESFKFRKSRTLNQMICKIYTFKCVVYLLLTRRHGLPSQNKPRIILGGFCF